MILQGSFFTAPKSKNKHYGRPCNLILSRQATKLIIGDPFNKGGPTLIRPPYTPYSIYLRRTIYRGFPKLGVPLWECFVPRITEHSIWESIPGSPWKLPYGNIQRVVKKWKLPYCSVFVWASELTTLATNNTNSSDVMVLYEGRHQLELYASYTTLALLVSSSACPHVVPLRF